MATHRPIRVGSHARAGLLRGLLALALLAGAGCGLGEYETLMDTERARVKVFDEENRLLDKPLTMPTNLNPKEGKAEEQPALLRMGVFLRPPRGFATKPDKDLPVNTQGVPLYRYAGPEGYNLFLAGDLGTLPAEQFQKDVLIGLHAYHQAAYNRALPPPVNLAWKAKIKQPLPGRTVSVSPVRLQTQTLEEKEGPGAVRYEIYYNQAKKNQVVVIYQVPREAADTPSVAQAIDFGLKGLGIGPENSAQQRKAYVERLAYFPGKR